MQQEHHVHEPGLAHQIGDVVAAHPDVGLVFVDDGGAPGIHRAIMPSAGAAAAMATVATPLTAKASAARDAIVSFECLPPSGCCCLRHSCWRRPPRARAGRAGDRLQASGKSPAAFPALPGRDVAVRICRDCHPTSDIANRRESRFKWAVIVEEMIGEGAKINDDDFETRDLLPQRGARQEGQDQRGFCEGHRRDVRHRR